MLWALLAISTLALLASLAAIALILRQSQSGADPLAPLNAQFQSLQTELQRIEKAQRDEASRVRDHQASAGRELREEVANQFKMFGDSSIRHASEMSREQKEKLEHFSTRLNQLTTSNEQRLEALRQVIEQRLHALQQDNALKLDQMRQTVDEKLQGTLEKRLTESFKLVSERLEQVHKGLGEMQSLANGVGDLKRVLSNVKSRGTFGEVMLENLIEDIFTPDQYEKNVATVSGSSARVEFAIKFPHRDDDSTAPLWMPIDAKFPMEDYQRLVEATERADPLAVEASLRELEKRVKLFAGDIASKYLRPPETTEFGILFVPTEGLYAEITRRPGLLEQIRRDYKVVIAGPTTLAALLTSFQMGFRTLAIQKRSQEVWKRLVEVKQAFGKYGDVLDKVQEKLASASKTIDEAKTKSRTIERQLKKVEDGDSPAQPLLQAGESEEA